MKLQPLNLLGLGLLVALVAAPVQAEPAASVRISQAIPLGNGLEQESGWYGSINPSVVFGPDFEGNSKATSFSQPFVCNDTSFDEFPGISSSAICIPPSSDPVYDLRPFSVSIETNTGFGISGAAGYRFTPALRAELELGYSRNAVESLTVGDVTLNRTEPSIGPAITQSRPKTDLDGKLETLSLMASGYYDINTNSNFKPYVGGGIGVARLSASDIEADIPGLNRRIDLDDSGASFIFQVKAGTAYQIGDRGSISLGYRLQGLPGQSFEADGIDFDAQTILTHAVEFGGQYRF